MDLFVASLAVADLNPEAAHYFLQPQCNTGKLLAGLRGLTGSVAGIGSHSGDALGAVLDFVGCACLLGGGGCDLGDHVADLGGHADDTLERFARFA
jgi:hypothetical protein